MARTVSRHSMRTRPLREDATHDGGGEASQPSTRVNSWISAASTSAMVVSQNQRVIWRVSHSHASGSQALRYPHFCRFWSADASVITTYLHAFWPEITIERPGTMLSQPNVLPLCRGLRLHQSTTTGRRDKREQALWRPNEYLASKRKPSRSPAGSSGFMGEPSSHCGFL